MYNIATVGVKRRIYYILLLGNNAFKLVKMHRDLTV